MSNGDGDPTGQTYAATLGIPLTALWSLRSNPLCPQPSTTDGQGNLTWTGSAATAMTAFVAQYQSAISRGWKISTADLPVANIVLMSTTSPGMYYSPPLVDPLFDFPFEL